MMDIVDRLSNDLKMYKKVILVTRRFPYKDKAQDLLRDKPEIKVYVDDEDESKLLDLYNMYEFSDKFVVWNLCDQYGSIWNYVDNGILTLQEAVDSYCL